MLKYNCYFQVLETDLDESLELIISVVNQYFDEQLFDIYNTTLIKREEFISYEQFKKDCRGLDIATKTSNKSSKEILKENEDILAMFKKEGD